MTLRELVVKFGFKVDKKSEKDTEKSIDGIKTFAKKALGTLAIGFSLVKINALAEEFNGINDQIKNATKNLGNQKDIQEKILKAANDTRSDYADTAKVVSSLVQESSGLFSSIDDAIAFNNTTTKLFKTAGKAESEISALQDMLNKSFAKGTVDVQTVNNLLEKSPDVVRLLNKQLGTTNDSLLKMAAQGKISTADLKKAFTNASDEINKNYDELDYSISDALRNIRNQWGLFCDSLWNGAGVGNDIGKMMVRAFTSLMDVLKKLQPYIERLFKVILKNVKKAFDLISRVSSFLGQLIKKIGGIEQAVKLVSIAAGAIFFAFKAKKILSFLQTVKNLMLGINFTTMLIIAVIVLLALAFEDFFNFMKGNDSLIGKLLEKAGIDTDEVRKKIIKVWNKIKDFLLDVWDGIKQAASMLFGTIKDFFVRHGDGIKSAFKKTWGFIKEFLNGVWTFISQLASTLFGKTGDDIEGTTTSTKDKLLSIWKAVMDALSAVWDAIYEVGAAVFGALSAAIRFVFDKIKKFWDTWGTKILAWFKVVWDSLGKILKGFLGIIKGIANFIKSVFTGDWKGAWKAIKDVFKNVWDAIVAFIEAIWASIKLTFEIALSFIKKIWAKIWNGIKSFFEGIWNGIVSFLGGIWSAIVSVFDPVVEFFTNIFQSAWDGICNVFSSVKEFFGGLWDSIVDIFGTIGSAVADAISGAVKGAINAVLNTAAGIINGFIKAINFAIGIINKIPGVKISKLKEMEVPQLAEGGIATKPTLAEIGEGKEKEAVLPLSKLGGMISGYIKQAKESQAAEFAREIAGTIKSGLISMTALVQAATAKSSTASKAANNKNVNVTQNVEINNSYSGGTAESQKNMSKGMQKSADDATSYMARGLAYLRT